MTAHNHTCDLCANQGGELLYQDQWLRVVLVEDALYPGFCRVIWQQHIAEMSDLAATQRAHMMAVVWQVEAVLRAQMQPHKINLASLGNMTPHLHWHVIPRFADDAHFPQPVWGQQQREAGPQTAARHALLPALRSALQQQLAAFAAQDFVEP